MPIQKERVVSAFEAELERLVKARVESLQDMGDTRPEEEIARSVRRGYQQRIQEHQRRMR